LQQISPFLDHLVPEKICFKFYFTHDRFYDVMVGKQIAATTCSQWEIKRSVQENIKKAKTYATFAFLMFFLLSRTFLTIKRTEVTKNFVDAGVSF